MTKNIVSLHRRITKMAMNELLKKLFEADVLSEDVKVQLEKAISTEINEAVEVAKAEAATQVRDELKQQWVAERDALVEAVDTKVNEYLVKELEDLKEDISRFRDLEAEYAEKLVEAKADMKQRLDADLATLVEKLDAFLELRLAAEMEELKEDMERVKKIEFGRNVFEAFVTEYRKNFVNGDAVEMELAKTREKLKEAKQQLNQSKQQLDEQVRTTKMKELLAPLSGKKREVMETILSKLPTDQLDEGFKNFIGRVVREKVEESKEKETASAKVLAEGSSDASKKQTKTIVKTGDDQKKPIEESVDTTNVVRLTPELEQLRRLAGITE